MEVFDFMIKVMKIFMVVVILFWLILTGIDILENGKETIITYCLNGQSFTFKEKTYTCILEEVK